MAEVRRVFKYPIDSSFVSTLKVPKGSKLLYVGNQKENLYAWVEITTSKETELIRLRCVTTGEDFLLDSFEYVGTVLFHTGNFVLHVYKEVI